MLSSLVPTSLPPSPGPLQVFPDKRSVKLIKSQSLSVNWYQYCPETAVLLLSTSGQGNVLQPFVFRVGGVCV